MNSQGGLSPLVTTVSAAIAHGVPKRGEPGAPRCERTLTRSPGAPLLPIALFRAGPRITREGFRSMSCFWSSTNFDSAASACLARRPRRAATGPCRTSRSSGRWVPRSRT